MAKIARHTTLAPLFWAVFLIAAFATPATSLGHSDWDFDMPGSGSLWQYGLLLINLDEVVETVAFYTFVMAVLLILMGVTYALQQTIWMAYTGLTIIGLIYIGLNDQNLTGIYWTGIELGPRSLLVFGHLMISVNFAVAGYAIDPHHRWYRLRWLSWGLAVLTWGPWFIGQGLTLGAATLIFNICGMLAGLSHAVPFMTFQRLEGGPDRDLRIGVATLGVLLILTTVIVSLSGQGWNVDIVLASRLLILAVTVFLVVFFIRRILAIQASREAAIAQTLADAKRETEMSRDLLAVQKQYVQTQEIARLQKERLATASHDIRQPIVSLRTTMAALTRDQPAATKTQLREAFDYLDQLAASYMDEAKGEVMEADDHAKPTGVEIVASDVIVQTIDRMFASEAEARGKTLAVTEEPCTMRAAPLALMRIMSNLTSNAIKHAAGGTVHLSVEPKDGAAVFVVANDGAMPDSDVFAAYKKGDGSDGQGLGLAIIQKLATNNGFDLSHMSDADTGTVFTLRVPLA